VNNTPEPPEPLPSPAKTYGVTHRGTTGETQAYMKNGRVWISDGQGGWLRCDPGVEEVFSPDDQNA
jgi:hypothetical protein